MMKGIVLAGGTGSRLYPATGGVCKQLLPVYDKPMIYYPLAVLMRAGIRDIWLITAPRDRAAFVRLLGNGSRFGIRLHYVPQPQPQGIAQAFVLTEHTVGGEAVCLILGDNIFTGAALDPILRRAAARPHGATVFTRRVAEPQHFGIITFDADGRPAALTEKPPQPESDWAVSGLYVYDKQVWDYARSLQPSARGELEITAVNQSYLLSGSLNAERLPDSVKWWDAGTPDSLFQAAAFVRTRQQQLKRPLACLEGLAWQNGWLTPAQMRAAAQRAGSGVYGQYLSQLAQQHE